MKLSLSWLFDHIDADWKKIDVPALVNLFNKTTAEIEGFEKISLDLKPLAAGKVSAVSAQIITLEVPEWKTTISMPFREGIEKEQIYLLVKENKDHFWAKLSHFGSQKEGLLGAFKIQEKELSGDWKKTIETTDYILHLDNKSINHRPDMWGHRGVAREIAALLNKPFKAIDHLLIPHALKEYEKKAPAGKEHTLSITVENPDACKRFAGLYFERIDCASCIPWMAARLAKVDIKPINAIVDTTNYVMLDLGQPMHAFDAQKLDNKSIVVRNAKNKETITVLDGQTLELTADDCVVTDGKKPIALAGIMGGKESGVSTKTTSIFLESACFDAAVIRKTAMRVKKRSESSARFEKSLDPNQNTLAIERFLKLLDEAKIIFEAPDAIVSIGRSAAQKELNVPHAFIEQLLGVSIASQFVVQTLEKLGFVVDAKKDNYHISIPSFRATKDIAIKQDIVEEVGRFYGYDKIGDALPLRQSKPFDLVAVMRMRRIKQLLAYALDMRELYTYAFFDESFLTSLDWQPGSTLRVQEAVSENWQRLVTSLVPNLLKAVQVHSNELDQMNFFEWARIWPQVGNKREEQSSVAGIFVDQKKQIDFYDMKQKLCKVSQLLGIRLDWIKADENNLQPWYLPSQTAYLMCDSTKVGVAGKTNPEFFNKVATGDAFIFEYDGNFLLSHHLPIKRYTPVHKYPTIARDVSMLIPAVLTIKELRDALQKLDPKIITVDLLDFFEKPEWKDQKSVTFRITLVDPAATMTSEQADTIMKTVTNYLQKQGATIR